MNNPFADASASTSTSNHVEFFSASIAEEMNPQKRHTMEDCHILHQPGTWNCNDRDLAYVGVYDGHGGRDTVDFLQDTLHESVAEELNHEEEGSTSSGSGDGGNANNDDNASISIETRLESAFLITDIKSQMEGIQTSGATVAICLIKRDLKAQKVVIHAANAGDGRAVLSCRPIAVDIGSGYEMVADTKKAHRLTHDHKADDQEEIDRIANAGGFLMRQRVLGIMAVTRSLGDAGLKEYVIAKPYCHSVAFHLDSVGREREFVIVACDGLWDTMEDQEAVDLVKSFVSKGGGDEAYTFEVTGSWTTSFNHQERKNLAANFLCKEALARGSCDNITVIVVWL